MSEKRKYFRFLPLLGGFLTLILCFIANIPLGSWITLDFYVLETSGTQLYIWGIVNGGVIWEALTLIRLENLIPLLFWILLLFTVICGFIGSSYKENPQVIKKLLLLGGLITSTELIYFTIVFLINLGTYSFGIGFYLLISIAFVYFLSAGLVNDYQKI